MGTVGVTATARVGFGDLTQDSLLKPTAVWRLMSGTLDHWWPAATGLPGPDYLEKTRLSTAMVRLEIERSASPVPDEHELVLDFASSLGSLPGRDGRPRRFGGLDRLVLRSVDDAERPPVARWTGWWLWFRPADDGRLGLVDEPVPHLLVDQDATLDGLEPPPPLSEPRPSSTFRWTPRETDLNQHVFFLSYLERAENALADAGIDTAALHRSNVWFLRPAFLGQAMTAAIVAGDGEHLVALHNTEREEVSAVVRLDPGREQDAQVP